MIRHIVLVFAAFLAAVGCNRNSGVASVTITWTHPKVSGTTPVTISDSETASRLFQLFEGIEKPKKGFTFDTPFYDAVVSFTFKDGRSLVAKVYLPRERVFPGMWKHPDGPLRYFDADAGQSRELVSILKPLMPKNAVYPESLAVFPPVNFNKGIPDFTGVDLPISGDFPKGYFQPGK
jgi:hypothetical protein